MFSYIPFPKNTLLGRTCDPIIITFGNLDKSVRSLLGPTTIYGICPGTYRKERNEGTGSSIHNLDPYFTILVRDLQEINASNFEVYGNNKTNLQELITWNP